MSSYKVQIGLKGMMRPFRNIVAKSRRIYLNGEDKQVIVVHADPIEVGIDILKNQSVTSLARHTKAKDLIRLAEYIKEEMPE